MLCSDDVVNYSSTCCSFLAIHVIFSIINRVVSFLRALRIVILVRVFRLASQKKDLEKVTRRKVSENKRR
ncbi:phosphatidylinositol 3,4,5-trisphosphate 3-phosphatase TPTE2-like isoform X1 [Astyanax mexicanus]|uniref:Phosphatidylinositol 3,4,5-trisphosphate 3-phosphatase TPTE2-like isoform X1 n=1 Tax=Astyanax mexicanus TaxID=7994 RepID=A0A8T2KQY0_ASTMX|nr:phosphatidylinositol 3,4,5-trisphosphate 3-phosphatase TPTE2-like isoform X1 [Astyanax mexicanus]